MIQQSHFQVYVEKNSKQYLKEIYLHTHVHCNIIHSSQKVEATQMSIKRWRDKGYVVYRYSEIICILKKKEILSHATTWVNFRDFMLSEISQSQKDKYYMIPVRWSI